MRITSREKPIGVNDDLSNSNLLQVKLVPKWSECMVHFLTTALLNDAKDNLKAKLAFLESCERFQLMSRILYYLGDDKILRLVIFLNNYQAILKKANVSFSIF